MRTILFIIGTLDSGGVAKSIVNLLNAMDRKENEVHLLVMSDGEGPFGRYVPEDVTVHRDATIAALLRGVGGLKYLVLHGHLLLAIGSLIRMALSQIDKPAAGWLLAQLFPALPGEWDVIVDYNGQQQLYYMVDKLQGGKKISFFHSDYKKWPYYERMDRRYFPKVDKICTISEQCVASLTEVFPEVAEKVTLFPNISLPSMIHRLAEEPVEMPELHGTVLLTIGHVCYNKGIDLAIEAAKILRDRGIEFTWLFLGSTDGADKYRAAIDQFNATFIHKHSALKPTSAALPHPPAQRSTLHLLGIQPNPYAYMKRADIIVHPSRFEGKSIALDEAKIMCKPIVVTNFSTVGDQFEDGVNATICEMTELSLYSAIKRLQDSPVLMQKYSQKLGEIHIDNSSELNELIES